MGVLTARERKILALLRRGERVTDIARRFGVSPTSISRSIHNIRVKVESLETDLRFLVGIGYLGQKNSGLVYLIKNRDPKSLARKK